MFTFTGKDPTQLHYHAFMTLLNTGDECAPRGKRIKELRPACFEFQNPYNRVTFLGSRRINPFFQVAEALWILSGRSDVEWLCKFNANMRQFSDDGVYFNAPYGERLRTYGKNSAHNVIINPVDQFVDVYNKLINDKDTRQAVMVISCPHFDNSKYTIGEKGRDIACLTGDTIISSPEGDLPLKDLITKDNYPIYSYNEKTGKVEIKKVVSGGLTRKNAELLKITLGDGTVLKLTPDHVCYRKKYAYEMTVSSAGNKHPINKYLGMETVQAQELKVGDRLPYLLRYKEQQGYVNLNTRTLSKSISDSCKEHIMYMEYHLGRSLTATEVVHHKNHNRADNRLSNLEVLEKSYHDSLDMHNNTRPCGTSKKRTSRELLTKENLFNTAIKVIESDVPLTVDTFKAQFEGVGCLSACKREFGNFKNLRDQAYAYLGKTPINGLSGSKGNPKSTVIISIERCDNEDVYDITVEDNHNFFANGYLVHNCNLVVTFKIRHNKLNMTVFNRSNDLIYGTFGANLNQFSTIQEMMLSWLKNSKVEGFEDLEIGTYCQITDSLHLYLDDYGSKCNQDIIDYYTAHPDDTAYVDFNSTTEPRMKQSQEQFDQMLDYYWKYIDPLMMEDELLQSNEGLQLVTLINDMTENGVIDEYWSFVFKAMLCYRLVKLDRMKSALEVLAGLQNCSWKVSMTYFLKNFIKKLKDTEQYSELVSKYEEISDSLVKSLANVEYTKKLQDYLKFD